MWKYNCVQCLNITSLRFIRSFRTLGLKGLTFTPAILSKFVCIFFYTILSAVQALKDTRLLFKKQKGDKTRSNCVH